jgi:hypothetical protein
MKSGVVLRSLASNMITRADALPLPFDSFRVVRRLPFTIAIRGDVLVCLENGTSPVLWLDTMGGTTYVHEHGPFEPKKFDELKHNADSVFARQRTVDALGARGRDRELDFDKQPHDLPPVASIVVHATYAASARTGGNISG